MGILTYTKMFGAVIVLIFCGYYVYNYHHMKTVIANQQLEIENLKEISRIMTEKQKTFEEYITKREQIRKRVSNEQKALDKEVLSTTDDNLIKLYDRYRVRTKDKGSDAQDGKGSSTKYKVR